ncbi:exported hypothetical protein [Microbacterium sp. C448]|nr:exported hypothetical protein [Microbacterium sp. C448]
MVRRTMSTRRKWRSRSPARWASRRPSARRTPSSSSRSCRSRCVLPRSTWATSSVTSTAAVVRSSRWKMPRASRSCGRMSRCPRCSATSVTCARRPPAVPSTPWSSTATPRFRRRSPRRSSRRTRASSSISGPFDKLRASPRLAKGPVHNFTQNHFNSLY